MKKRKLIDRILDRVWYEIGKRQALDVTLHEEVGGMKTSISCEMPWVSVCSAFATGKINSHHFRRLRAVKEVVETVGISDARFYAQYIRNALPDILHDPRLIRFDDWGHPMRCPALLLGTKRSFSPTSLRYLATAIWIANSGKLSTAGKIIEIGVGFGGLAVMNAIVSRANTYMVDLPDVSAAAAKMMEECSLNSYLEPANTILASEFSLLVSNYAFTELTREAQDFYLEQYLSKTKHGLIISNANVFWKRAGGRSDNELVKWLNDSGIPASIDENCDLLSPIDNLCGVKIIHW